MSRVVPEVEWVGTILGAVIVMLVTVRARACICASAGARVDMGLDLGDGEVRIERRKGVER